MPTPPQASTNGPRVADLLQTVADATTDAQDRGLDVNQVLNLVVIAAGVYGRTVFGDDYLDNLCAALQRLRGKEPPDSNIDEISH